jgi:hypothetical protein
MPHSCQTIIKHQYEILVAFYFSPEGGRIVESVSAAAAIIGIASLAVRKMLVKCIAAVLAIGLVAAVSSSAVLAVHKQLRSCRLASLEAAKGKATQPSVSYRVARFRWHAGAQEIAPFHFNAGPHSGALLSMHAC